MILRYMALIKVKEIIGTSPDSFEDAIKDAISQLSELRENVTGLDIIGATVEVNDGKIVEYKVNAKYAYRWEKELNK